MMADKSGVGASQKTRQKAMESESVVALPAVWQVLVPDISIATHIFDLFK